MDKVKVLNLLATAIVDEVNEAVSKSSRYGLSEDDRLDMANEVIKRIIKTSSLGG